MKDRISRETELLQKIKKLKIKNKKLKVAKEALEEIAGQGYWGHNNSVKSLVKILDENTKTAEKALLTINGSI